MKLNTNYNTMSTNLNNTLCPFFIEILSFALLNLSIQIAFFTIKIFYILLKLVFWM